jgi:hypothetical protein
LEAQDYEDAWEDFLKELAGDWYGQIFVLDSRNGLFLQECFYKYLMWAT